MADDSEHIKDIFEYHPCDTPRGMLYYKLSELTCEQQEKLNSLKVKNVRSNHIYLHDHPEVQIIISTLLNGVLKARPKYHVHKFLVRHLMESWAEIKKKVDLKTSEKYKKMDLQKQRTATIAYLKQLYDEEFEDEGEGFDERHLKKILKCNVETTVRNVLDDIIQTMEAKEKHHVHIQMSESSSDSDIELDVRRFDYDDSDYD